MRYSLYEQLEWFHGQDEWTVYPNMLLHYDEKQGEFAILGGSRSTASRINKLNPKPHKDGVIIVTDFEILDGNKKKVVNVAIPETHPAYNARLLHLIENKCNKSFDVKDLVSEVINNVVKS
jgi:hypothetical protein